jgi:hypothetical protein
MKVECQKGWKNVLKLENVTLEDSTVNILDSICDSSDLCGIEACEFYDLSEEASERFCRA